VLWANTENDSLGIFLKKLVYFFASRTGRRARRIWANEGLKYVVLVARKDVCLLGV